MRLENCFWWWRRSVYIYENENHRTWHNITIGITFCKTNNANVGAYKVAIQSTKKNGERETPGEKMILSKSQGLRESSKRKV